MYILYIPPHPPPEMWKCTHTVIYVGRITFQSLIHLSSFPHGSDFILVLPFVERMLCMCTIFRSLRAGRGGGHRKVSRYCNCAANFRRIRLCYALERRLLGTFAGGSVHPHVPEHNNPGHPSSPLTLPLRFPLSIS